MGEITGQMNLRAVISGIAMRSIGRMASPGMVGTEKTLIEILQEK